MTVVLVGCVVIVGPVLTVSVAALVVAVPTLFVNTAWYSLPLSAAGTLEIVSVVDVAPLTFVNVEPPLVDTCHCTVGVGVPLAAAEPPALRRMSRRSRQGVQRAL